MSLEELPLLEFVHELSPDLSAPYHLSKLANLLERTETEKDLRGLSSVATRHGKTTLIGHHVARSLKRNPKREFVYFTFDADFAGKKSREFRNLSKAAGVKLSDDFNTIKEWRTAEGGGLFACSVGQHVVGRGFSDVLVDDPLGSAAEADDADRRDEVEEAIRFLTTRVHPGGSVLVNASRFHPKDPIAVRLIDDVIHWEHVEAPAIRDLPDGKRQALWPDRWPLEALDKKRAELAVSDPYERTWWAQYMGDPKPVGSDLFHDPQFWTKLPNWNYRRGYGVDFAYSVGDGADWFARVVGRTYGTKLYVLDVVRHKIEAHLIESTCKADLHKYGRAPFFSYMSGPEIGLARVLNERGVPVAHMQARYNKLVRAQRTIKRWNDGDILVPEETYAPWVRGFLHRVSCFRGRERDTDDDEVDALVSLCDGIMGGGTDGGPKVMGRPLQSVYG